MSDEKSKVTDKASEIAKNIWLAGVGAYGRAVDEAQGALERAATPPKLFRELVRAGSVLEEEAREARASARSSVEERIRRVRENFHQQRPARVEDLEALCRKVDQLSRKIDALSRTLAEQGIIPPRKKGGAAAGKKSTSSSKATTQTGSDTPKRQA
jgi:polyhydroxyalkanoate synthesis regulator phasin